MGIRCWLVGKSASLAIRDEVRIYCVVNELKTSRASFAHTECSGTKLKGGTIALLNQKRDC